MNRGHRSFHRMLWPMLALIVALGFTMALVLRPPPEPPSPAEGANTRTEDSRIRVQLPQSLCDCAEANVRIAASNHKDARSTESFERLAETARRHNLFTAEWVQAVDEHNIDITV